MFWNTIFNYLQVVEGAIGGLSADGRVLAKPPNKSIDFSMPIFMGRSVVILLFKLIITTDLVCAL